MAERFDKFTEGARRVLQLAQEESQRLSHNYIGTEHLLLGLLRADGLGNRALTNLGMQLTQVREAVLFVIGRGERTVTGDIGLTPRAKRVIEHSVEQARLLDHNYIGTEHLLLGLIDEGDGIASGILETFGASLEAVREEIHRLLGAPGPRPAPGEPAPIEPPTEYDLEAPGGSLDLANEAIRTLTSNPTLDCRVVRLDPSQPVHVWLPPPRGRGSLVIVLSGRGELESASGTQTLHPHRLWVLPPGSFDRIVPIGQPMTMLCFEVR
jgi:ATP-dependent Clp protease ATP-binding subunit ClpA